jgi:hypothetical protein
LSNEDHAYIRFTLKGEPARILRDLIKRGIACKYKDAISQALLSYYGEVLDRELKTLKVRDTRDEAAILET